ncbi:MAG: PAS domain S-box protein, partial [Bacillus sp. (in: Bacteria)]|nr:PAS domain S-box protein [Bacillus sp. (in: firmicutes)]
MNEMIGAIHPYFIIIAIGLTIMASYTAVDMFTLIRSSTQNKRLLFLGGIFSMGIGIWVMNFIGLISADTNRLATYHIPITILSIFIGIAFTGMAFITFYGKIIKLYHLMAGALFLTFAVISTQVIGLYAMNVNITYNVPLFIFSGLLIFGLFLFSLWVLFSSKSYTQSNQVWLKPISAIIMTIAIAEGHFLLKRASIMTGRALESASTDSPFFSYLVVFVAVLIIGGLIASSALISKQLATSDTNLKDIRAALDASTIVAITDPQGRISFVNDKFEEISKYKKEEIIGQNHRILNS